MRQLAILLIGLLCASVSASAQDGWVTLVDTGKMGDWNRVGAANWRMDDGILTADKLDGKDPGYLVSKTSYKDFQIRAEFWVDTEANSGAAICYEVNIFDKRPDPKYGTGAIVDVAAVVPMPKAAGKWNTYEITAQGNHFVVILNGQKTVDVTNDRLPAAGNVGLQYGSGALKFRKVQIRSL